MTDIDLSLYLITTPVEDMLNIVEKAIAGGVSMVQFRDKTHSYDELIQWGKQLREITSKHNIPFIVNDSLDLAIELKADGLHVGQEDIDAVKVRKTLGENFILGVSAGNIKEARAAESAGADYIGVGDLFGTASKENTGGAIGLDRFKEITHSVSIPSVAIGGITIENTTEAVKAGASGVSVISAIFSSKDPQRASWSLKKAVLGGKA